MKKINIFAILIAVAVVGFFVYTQVVKPALDNRMITAVVAQTIENEPLSFGFTYPSGEAGYMLIEPPVPTTTSSGLQKVYLLMNTQAYIDFQSVTDSETPPTVSVFVLQLPPNDAELNWSDRLKQWAAAAPQFSSYALRTGEPEEVEIDGVQALRYYTDGLYQQQVYLARHDGNAYVFIGQYNDPSDEIKQMFDELIGSVLFY